MSLKPWITFQEKLKYQFKLPALLEEALTHKSYAHEHGGTGKIFAHNERLEYLGDAVVDLAISRLLMQKDFKSTEGELSKRRASLVNEATLAEIGRELEINQYLILGKGEILSQGQDKNSIISSALEAVFGAIFIDAGFDSAMEVIERNFNRKIDEISVSPPFEKDFKSRLQEVVQNKYKRAPTYKIESSFGPEHAKIFQVGVFLDEKKIGEGQGKSKKEAEQFAARKILEAIDNV